MDREERCVAAEEDDDESTSSDDDEARRPPFCTANVEGVAMNRAVAKIMVTRGEGCRCRCCIMMFFINRFRRMSFDIVEPNKSRELQDESFCCCCCILALFCKPIVSYHLLSPPDTIDVVSMLLLLYSWCVLLCCVLLLGGEAGRGCGCRNFYVNSKA